MTKACISSILCAVILVAGAMIVEAQSRKKIPRIGFLIARAASSQERRIEAFRRGLREFGYIEGQNIILEIRSGEGRRELLATAATELANSKVEIIVSGGPASIVAARKATDTIPIIMTLESDPVGDGLIDSLSRPGRNITGLSTLGPELSGKRLELLKEIVTKLSRVAVFSSQLQSSGSVQRKELDAVTKALRLRLQYLEL